MFIPRIKKAFVTFLKHSVIFTNIFIFDIEKVTATFERCTSEHFIALL